MVHLLERPRDEACRVVALDYLDEAVEARGRLGQDPEALHDLRVALRRMRSTLRAYRELVGRPLDARGRKRLRQIVDATSISRDAEVLAALVAEEAAHLYGRERAGADWLQTRLATRKADGDAQVEKRLAHFARIERRLRRRLSRVQIDLLNPHKQAHALAELVESHTDDVEDDLMELQAPDQVEDAHAARISVKRLRYLVEPFEKENSVAKLVEACKSVQDLLGDLHDAHVAAAEIAPLLPDPNLPAELREGLAALALRLELRQVRLFTRLQGEWLPGTRLVTQARALAVELRNR